MKAEMQVIKFSEFEQIWHKFSRQAQANEFSFELEVYKKLLNIFHVGEYYYYIFNLTNAQIELVSDLVKNVMKLDATQEFTAEYVYKNIHPEDLPVFVDFEQKAGEFIMQLPPEKVFKYKISYDYRLKRKDGRYIRILQQVMPIQGNSENGILRTLCTHTNITHIKKDNTQTLSLIGLDGEPSYPDFATSSPKKLTVEPKFTRRENAVLQLLMEGKNNHEIADQLHISKLTVDTHRRNMLQKTNVRSMAELTLKYMQGNLE